jgi:putative YphP/YqiW family bacilliredoxin
MYPEEMIASMRQDLTASGVQEVRDAATVESLINSEGTTLFVVNSVCGCAAANARPAVKMALQNEKLPTRSLTSFAGNDREAVSRARELMAPYPPSSPSIALFKDGVLVHMIERHHIEGRPAELIADNLKAAFDAHC